MIHLFQSTTFDDISSRNSTRINDKVEPIRSLSEIWNQYLQGRYHIYRLMKSSQLNPKAFAHIGYIQIYKTREIENKNLSALCLNYY